MPREGTIHSPTQLSGTQPTTYIDPQAFDTTRYSSENLTFWAPHLIRIGQMAPSTPVLDLGCGTGGFTLVLQALTGAPLVGVDIALRFLQYAAQKPASRNLWWVQGYAAALPFPEATFARVLISLALHQFSDRARVLTEVARILQPRGLLIIRTITPEAARQRIPSRFFPRIAAMEAARMPTRADLETLLTGAGFTIVEAEVVERHKALDFQTVLREVQARPSYRALTTEEYTHGVTTMQEEWQRHAGPVVDPRPTLFLVGQQQGR